MSWRVAVMVADLRDGLLAQPGRTGLSLFSIFVGVAVLTLLLGVLHGLHWQGRRIVQDFGVNAFAIHAEDLREQHLAVFRQNLSGAWVAGVREGARPGSPRVPSFRILGTDPDLTHTRDWAMEAGRFLDAYDCIQGERNAVVSHALSRQLGRGVGEIVMLQRTAFIIVGVLQGGGGTPAGDSPWQGVSSNDPFVCVPLAVLPGFEGQAGVGSSALDRVFIKARNGEPLDSLLEQARTLVAAPDLRLRNPAWITPDRLLAETRRLQRILRWTAGSVAALCLVLGGTTLMSLLVANVRDRIPEIGLRRTLGAGHWDIAGLFIAESVILALVAALPAMVLGHLGLALIRSRAPVPVMTGWVTWLVPVIVALAVGIAFSSGPAYLAARVIPADALRNE